jgi:uroporphyrinogen decarboxylase
MGPDLWREFIAPRVARLYREAKSHGKYVFIHCCGQITGIFDDLIDFGVDCFNPLQPEVMDVLDIKRRYGDRLSFYGGISTQRMLPFGTVGDVRDEVGRLLRDLGEGGGYIASPAHAIPPDARPENVAEMIRILREQ